ncbi:MAG: GGDEF domain-containing protein, partial [Angelakisella sp.]
MTMYEQYLEEHKKCWQKRIVKTNFVAATVVLIFEIAYYFILTGIGLRDQTPTEYVVLYILLPAGIIYTSCAIGWFVVYRSHQSAEVKSLSAMAAMVAICSTSASVHNIFGATLCSFFVPLSFSVVFGERRITNAVGGVCAACELLAMYFASLDLRGKDPYFLLDCLMLFIVFGIVWYTTLLLMKNEQEKRTEIDRMWREQSILQQRVCHDELTGLYNMLGLQLYADGKINENNRAYLNSSLAFLDIDDFKHVNDTFGHEVGNVALVNIADCIRRHFPVDACVVRYGGDEFVVLLPGVPVAECAGLLNLLLAEVASAPIAELAGSTLSLSCGVSCYDFCKPVLEAIDSSDRAMYEAKTTGKNRCVV